MTTYTITITPDDSSATTTTLRLDTSGGDVTLTDLHLHAGGGLSTGALPAIDYGMLLQAVAPSAPTPVLSASTPTRQIEAAPEPQAPAVEVVAPVSRPRASRSTRSTATKAPAAETPAPAAAERPSRSTRSAAAAATAATAPAAAPVAEAEAPAATVRASRSTRATGRRAATKAAPAETETAPKARSRRAAATKTAAPSGADAAKAKKTAKSAPAKKATRATSAGERAYRRMPDDFATVYQQAGNAAAVADHYSVPRHTAHGWIRRLKQDGTSTNR